MNTIRLISAVSLTLLAASGLLAGETQPSVETKALPSDLSRYIQMLGSAKTDYARETLLRIAVDKRVTERHATRAAYAFRSMVTNKVDAAPLLDSPHEAVRQIGLLKMMHGIIDRGTWETKLLPLLTYGTVRDKELLIAVVQADQGEIPAKAAALLKAMEGIETAPGSTRHVGYDDWEGSNYHLVYRYLVDALVQMEGIDLDALRQLTPQQEGLVRDCVLIARVSKGDVTVKQEVRNMALKHPQYLLKVKAVRAFVASGTPEDIPVLEQVARTDSRAITNNYPPAGEFSKDGQPRIAYPLREEAKYGITNIMKRSLTR